MAGASIRVQMLNVVEGSRHGTEACGCLLRSIDHNSDDNADDSCGPNYTYDKTFRPAIPPVQRLAPSWQCGGQGFESP